MVALTPRRFIAPSAVVWLLLGALYFFVPLVATLIFSLKSDQTGSCCTLANYGTVIDDPQFWTSFRVSVEIALETIVITLLLMVPTVYWVHLKVPKLRGLIGFLALVPFVVAPIILVVGLLKVFKDWTTSFVNNLPLLGSHIPESWIQWFYSNPHGLLAASYVVLAFPYMYFSLDTGFRSIDVHTLTEASQSLGGRWTTTLGRVILPNIRAAALAGSFLTLAIVMGEFTIASLAHFDTFPIYIQYINQNKAFAGAAITLLSFAITWVSMLALLFVGGRRASVGQGGA